MIGVYPHSWDSELAIWPQKVDLVITRVPIRKKEGFSSKKFKEFSKRLFNSMEANSLAFLVCYAPIEDRTRPFEVCKLMVDSGFNHVDNIIIEKTWIPGRRSEVNLVNAYDFVLFFSKGNKYQIDRTPVQEYLQAPYEILAKESKDQDFQMPTESGCIGNLWLVQTDSLEDPISNDLADLLVLFSSVLPGSQIFDPFGGSKSLIKSASKLQHSLTIFEGNPKKFKTLEETLIEINRKDSK